MFFTKLFKNKKGDKKEITNGLFNLAVIVNIVSIISAILLLFSCVFVKTEFILTIFLIALATMFSCYVSVIVLAWMSALINKDTTK